MKCVFSFVVCCSLIIVMCQLAIAESPGICLVKHMKTKEKYEVNRELGRWILTRYQEPVTKRECCEGYKPINETTNLVCEPICEPRCQNSLCEAPNACVCFPGHVMVNNSTSTCIDICESCINSACRHDIDAGCICNEGFEKDMNLPHVCNPICSPPCVNATCESPGVCKCFENFTKEESNINVCRPTCKDQCMFGECTDVDECTCYPGYMNDNVLPNICVPVCQPACENGFCAEPDLCKCNSGFTRSLQNPFHCVQERPEKSSLNYCELKFSDAIQHDKDNDCYRLRENIFIKKDSQCSILNSLVHPKCFQDNSCSLNDCTMSFRCSMVSFNGTNEIHCDLEPNDFETEESLNVTVSGTDWTNVTIVLNVIKPMNFTTVLNVSNREWELRPLSKWPVCGQEHFGVEICGSTSSAASNAQMNSSFLSGITILLIVCFALLVCVGIGAFLWLRHRKLNDPLNYREDMLRGYHTNQNYEGRPTELIPDDELERNEDDNL